MNNAPVRIPRVIFSGVSSGVGKSLLVMGVIVALRKQGMSVAVCNTGGALHQSLIYTRLSRRYGYTLDLNVLDQRQIISTIHQAELGSDIVLIDGIGGLYDGVAPGDVSGSDAEIAELTKTPVVLVANASECTTSLAALVKGYADFLGRDQIRGVIANRVNLPEEVGPILLNPVVKGMNDCMAAYGLPAVIGGVPDAHFSTPIPVSTCNQVENRTALPREFYLDVASLVSNHVDISELLAIADSAPLLPITGPAPEPRVRMCRIAVSDDICFNVAYQDNLAWLTHHGAEIVPFSPLADNELPKRCGGVYITGGYLDTYGGEVARNERIRESIKHFAEQGGVIFSEGAGTAYLCRSYQSVAGGTVHPGVGLIEADAIRVQHPRGVVTATLVDESVLGPSGGVIKGISTGEWGLRGGPGSGGGRLLQALRVVVGDGNPLNEGFSPTAQALNTFHFLHFGSNPAIARALVDAASVSIPS